MLLQEVLNQNFLLVAAGSGVDFAPERRHPLLSGVEFLAYKLPDQIRVLPQTDLAHLSVRHLVYVDVVVQEVGLLHLFLVGRVPLA